MDEVAAALELHDMQYVSASEMPQGEYVLRLKLLALQVVQPL